MNYWFSIKGYSVPKSVPGNCKSARAVYLKSLDTVVLKRESKWLDLWSKWPISDLFFYHIKMLPCSCPLGSSLLLTGSLKWGTVQTSTSTNAGIMKGKSQNFESYLIENKC